MKVLISGKGTSGSWKIRGEQLGEAIGADVIPNATSAKGHDVVVMVKRLHAGVMAATRAAGAKLVWDIVDAWPQPVGNEWSAEQAMAWLKSQLEAIRPDFTIAATHAMAKDIQRLGFASACIVHHARPGIALNPLRDEVRAVVYEGGPQYLGKWGDWVMEECRKRNWAFLVNPTSIVEGDIVVALRDAGGYPAKVWKSNVKLANAQATGTPFVGSMEAGYLETAVPGAEKFVGDRRELARVFDALTPAAERRRVAKWMKTVAPDLPRIAKNYSNLLAGIHDQGRC